jgi:hypothetical protein
MLCRRIKDTIRAVAIGCIWFILMLAGFLAMDYQDDLVLGAYVIAGATGLTAFIGWILMGN